MIIGLDFHCELAIDYSTGNLYYTAVASTSRSYIGSVHRNTSLHKTLLSTLETPLVIVLYPSKGFFQLIFEQTLSYTFIKSQTHEVLLLPHAKHEYYKITS